MNGLITRKNTLWIALFVTLLVAAFAIHQTREGDDSRRQNLPIGAEPSEACSITTVVTPLDAYSTDARAAERTFVETPDGDRVKLTVNSQFLTAETEAGKTTVAVAQPDFGAVESVDVSQSGDIFVLGDQFNYRTELIVKDSTPILREPSRLPVLFSRPCSTFNRIMQTCTSNAAVYSRELDLVFLSGYDSRGAFKSLVFGLKTGDSDISRSETPFFFGDVPSEGKVLLSGPKGFALYDGLKIEPCNNT